MSRDWMGKIGYSKECSFILGYSAMEDTYASEIERKELLQKKHYFFLNELQQMARELPSKYQQRVPYDLLSGLAHALLDGTVFEIVQGLSEVQHLEEKSLFNQRVKQTNDHKAQKHEMTKKHKELLQACENKPHNLPLVQAQVDREREIMNKRIEEESKKKDIKTIMELDQKVMDQQVTLEKAGVPGFYVTNNPAEIRLQIYLLEFIVRLRNTELPT
ncbi:protein DGCR6 isoform X2 [Octopus bimaculoides]|uniref:protein DGCR6 isoform X2 n=1 Tax=Octopus bimaculoides TaxID=37653 RepID=UPI00071CD46D|nr:protein DGCR6 isoform X2 [Octopus bimaculoides]|eukprot:XP_014774716.1 PREDICTED: protein DGCR6-like isoform X2 [Octopus bimaculoides]